MAQRRRKKKFPEGIFQAQIESLTHEGRGIAKINGKTTFIAFGLPGEEVEFQYTYSKSRYDEGQVTNVLTPSSERVKPICEAYERCGGCSFQHVSPNYQIEHKQNVLSEQLSHFGHLQPETWLDPLKSPLTQGYRRKARMGVRYVIKKEKVLVGFRERNGRYLADISTCPVLHPSVGNKIEAMQELIVNLDCLMTLPQIEVAVDDAKTALIIRHLENLSDGDLQKIVNFGQEHNFWIYLQPKGPSTVHLIYPELPSAEQFLSYQIPSADIEIKFQPNDFTQVNSELNQLMLQQAINLLDIQPDETILDLFCGLGNFSLPIARLANKVIGIEGDEPMTQRAYANAQHNQINNVEFHVADLFGSIEQFDWSQNKYDKVLLDPPRAGAETVCQNIKLYNPKKIVYISCNPATLARDAGILVNENGYTLKQAGVMDMFPHTAHVESIAVFERA